MATAEVSNGLRAPAPRGARHPDTTKQPTTTLGRTEQGRGLAEAQPAVPDSTSCRMGRSYRRNTLRYCALRAGGWSRIVDALEKIPRGLRHRRALTTRDGRSDPAGVEQRLSLPSSPG